MRKSAEKNAEKKKLYTALPAFQSLSPSASHTHKHIVTNTYTSKQRCHFTQEGSAVLSIRQGLVLGQRLLPNLRPPSPGSTGPLWPPSGPHHPRDKLPIVPALLINDSSPVQTNFRAHSKHTHTLKLSINGALYESTHNGLKNFMQLFKSLSDTLDGRIVFLSWGMSFVPCRPDEVMLKAHLQPKHEHNKRFYCFPYPFSGRKTVMTWRLSS